MKVKAGAIAIITKGREHNIGKLVIVTSFYGNVDYSSLGYCILPCWNVQSLGVNARDAGDGTVLSGFIPEMALVAISTMGTADSEALRNSKAQQDFENAIKELGEILRCMETERQAEKAAKKVIRKVSKTKRRKVHD